VSPGVSRRIDDERPLACRLELAMTGIGQGRALEWFTARVNSNT